MNARSFAVERWLFAGLVGLTTAVAVLRLWGVLRIDGVTPLKLALLALFASLFSWIAASFWLAALGAWLRWLRIGKAGYLSSPVHGEGVARNARRRGEEYTCTVVPPPSHNVVRCSTPPPQAGEESDPRTAIIMPICNEDAVEVFARIEAMHESLGKEGDEFDFFILSDSGSSSAWLAEELEWDRLRRACSNGARIYYRHRLANDAHKSGNIRDFCENWGARYEYMVVLDADSLMTGATLVELVRRMDASPRVALIQVPPTLIGRRSLFARIQQFASSVYGPLFWEGLAYLQREDGNYWGHNTIVRVQPFMQNCGLAKLPGRAPLGGEILSHDFVEAALLRRAGWGVVMAPDLGGSFEEPPPGLVQHLKRDRRWCEGNLQHIRLIFARGFRLPSRMHLAVGVMSYLSAPIWLVMIAVAVAETYRYSGFTPFRFDGRYPILGEPNAHPLEFALLAVVAALLLYGPKILALVVLAREPAALRAHGGLAAAAQSVLWESIFSTLLAPVVMLSHAWYVISIFFGGSVRWSAQQRSDCGTALTSVTRAFAPHTAAGVCTAALAWYFMPGSLLWLAPFLAGLVFAIPLAVLTDGPGIGQAAMRLRLFTVPAETTGIPIAERFKAMVARRQETRFYADAKCLPRLVIEDPFVNALHRALLRDVVPDDENIDSLRLQPARDDWWMLLADPERLREAAPAPV